MMAAQGLTSPKIGKALRIGVRTVEMHVSNGYSKLGIHCRAEFRVGPFD
jgi:DNA-binding NarL/FixJ family response regulator